MRYLRNQICQAAILANHNGVAAKIITSLLPSAPLPPPQNQWCAVKLKNSVQEESEVQRELWFSVCYTTNAKHAINKLMSPSKKFSLL